MTAFELPFRILPAPPVARGISAGLALSLVCHVLAVGLAGWIFAGEAEPPPPQPPVVAVTLLQEPQPQEPQPQEGAPSPPPPPAAAERRVAVAKRPALPRRPAPRSAPQVPQAAPAAPPPSPRALPEAAVAEGAAAPQVAPPEGEGAAGVTGGSLARAEPGQGAAALRVYGAGEVDVAPRALERPSPSYPERARRLGREADREVSVTVGRDGRVLDARVVDARGDEFDREAVAGVRRWRFAPARRGNQAVVSKATVTVRFRLDR